MNRPLLESHSGLEEKSFFSGEVKINYAEGPATGPPLLLLHGLGRRWQIFLSLIPSLALRWQIFAPDFRGHGRSGRVPRGYHLIEYGSDIVRLLYEKIQEPAVIFGHSLGGVAAMWIAAQYPDLVRALILGDTVVTSDSFYKHPMYLDLFAKIRDLAQQGGSVEELANGLARIELQVEGLDEPIPLGNLPGNDEAFLLWWARCVQQVDPEAITMTLDRSAFAGWEGEPLLRQIRCPVLFLQANPAMGGLLSDEDLKRALSVLPHAAHVRFPTLGHALHIQQPEPVLRAITNFLESLSRSEYPA